MSTMDIDRIIWIVFLVLAITTFILWRRNKRKNQPLTVRNESVEETPSKEAVEAKYGEALCRLLGRAAAIDGGVDSTRHAKAEAELKVRISKLFLAGFLPGLLTVAGFMLAIAVMTPIRGRDRLRPAPQRGRSCSPYAACGARRRCSCW